MENIKKLTNLFEESLSEVIFGLNSDSLKILNSSINKINTNNIRNPKILLVLEMSNSINKKTKIPIILSKELVLYSKTILNNEIYNSEDNILDIDLTYIEEIFKATFSQIKNNNKDLDITTFNILSIKKVEIFKSVKYEKKYQAKLSINDMKGSLNLYIENMEKLNLFLTKQSKVGISNIVKKNKTNNMDRINDINLKVSLRIGSTKMLLKDIIDINIGKIIELNQLANEPLEIWVENNLIGYGEVVVVDGNFGVEIVNLVKEDIL